MTGPKKVNNMELSVIRHKKTSLSTIGNLYVDGIKKWVTLEDTDRGLNNEMPLDEIASIKVKGKTAIPTGRYKVTKYKSPTRGWCLLVNNVPGFNMIEIHVGNYATDTEGCLLVGMDVANVPDMIVSSKAAIKELYDLTFPLIEAGKDVWITYQ